VTAISHTEHRGSPEPLLSGNFSIYTGGTTPVSSLPDRDLTGPAATFEAAGLALPLGGDGGPAGAAVWVAAKVLRPAGLPREFTALLREES
jgi:hypothetical protein